MTTMSRAIRAFDAVAFTERHGGRKESRYAGSHEYLLPCPRCGSNRLRWNSVKATWICWSCKETGDTVTLVALLEKCSYEEAVLFVDASYVGGDAPTRLAPIAAKKTTNWRLPAMTLPPSVPAWQSPRVCAYLIGRGIDIATMQRYGIFAGVDGPTKDYAIFPCRMDGATVYWQGRASWDPPWPGEYGRAWAKATGFRKTLNPPSRDGRASGAEVLFGYDSARTSPHVVIVEGPVDAIKVGPHAVGLFGQGTQAKLARLRAMKAQRYTIYLDRGEQERHNAERLARELSPFGATYIATPPEGYDAGKLTPEQNAAVVLAAEKYVPTLESRLAK